MEVPAILVMIVAVSSTAVTDAIARRRLLAAGHGWLRSTAAAGFTGLLAIIATAASCSVAGQAIWTSSL